MVRHIRALKQNFTSGEIDPLLQDRTDIKHYLSGAERMENVIPLPQGGFKRRPGLKFIYDMTSLNPDDGVKMVPFEFDVDNTYMLCFVNTKILVVKNGAVVHTITGTPWTGAQCAQINWAQSQDTLIVTHPSVAPYSIVRVSDTNWTVAAITFDYIPQYDYTPATSNPAATLTPSTSTGEIKITASAAIFTSAYVNQKIEMNGGLLRVVQYNTTTEIICVDEIPLLNTDAITSGNWTYHSGFEDVWSASKGWPAAVTFHENRLYFAGGPRPATIWGSRIASYFDFKPLTGLADEPVEVTLDTDTYNSIVNILSNRDLQVFTRAGEFYCTERPITPNNIGFAEQSNRGSKQYVRPVKLDGATLFAQRGGGAIREFYYLEQTLQYTADSFSLLASHLIQDPVALARRGALDTEDADLLLLVNSNGAMAICSTMRGQQIIAWARVTTPGGTFLSCGVDDQDMYVIVERTVNSGTVQYLEKFDTDHLMDCSVRVTAGLPTSTVTAAHLVAEDVSIVADDSVMADATLDGSGQATIARDAEEYYEVGLNPTVQVTTLNVEAQMQEGTIFNRKKRIHEVMLSLVDTRYVKVNGQVVPFRQFGAAGAGSPLDDAPDLFTGRKTIEGFLGFTEEAQVTISQDLPAAMTVQAMAIKVSV